MTELLFSEKLKEKSICQTDLIEITLENLNCVDFIVKTMLNRTNKAEKHLEI